ncbi:unnamed protein product [Rotaria sp. Silwood1]|nr:unnamed protein product [Rotaria sp. Silwood1]
MAIHHIHDPSSQLTDEHVSHPLHDIDQNDMSQPSSSFTATPPRKRSHSVLHWMQKALNVKTTDGSHGDSPSRHRSSSIAHYRKPSPSEKSPPVSYPGKKHRRPRAPTIDTIDSTDKKMPPRKKTISDTDEKAQQTRSTTNHDEINNGFLRVSQQTLQRIRDTINYLITKIQQHEETIIKEIENNTRDVRNHSVSETKNPIVELEKFNIDNFLRLCRVSRPESSPITKKNNNGNKSNTAVTVHLDKLKIFQNLLKSTLSINQYPICYD